MGDKWHCYCDESCIGRPNRYMVIGGVLVHVEHAREIKAQVLEWRPVAGMNAELKWQKVSDQKLPHYQEFMANRLADILLKHIAFCALILDRHLIDNDAYNNGSDMTAQSKFFYQMILHKFIPLMPDGDQLCVFPDIKSGPKDYNELQAALNNGIKKTYPRRGNSIAKVQPLCSKTTQFGQINDLLIGAVSFQANGRHLMPSTRAAKTRLAEFIAEGVKLPCLSEETPRDMSHFVIWRFPLKPRMKKGAAKSSRISDPHVDGSLTSSRGSKSAAPPEL